jgi:hypothetical protein
LFLARTSTLVGATRQMNARRHTYVDPEVQGALARRLVLHWAIFIITATLLIFGMTWLSDPFLPASTHFHRLFEDYGPALLTLICLAPIFVYDAVRLSSRFTGPMLRLKNATKALASGETPAKIHLRGDDFWQEVAADFNRVIERLDPGAKPEDHRPTATSL